MWEGWGGCGEFGELQQPRGGGEPLPGASMMQAEHRTSHQHSLPAPEPGEAFLTQFGPFSPSFLLSLALWCVTTCPTCLSNPPDRLEVAGPWEEQAGESRGWGCQASCPRQCKSPRGPCWDRLATAGPVKGLRCVWSQHSKG